MKINQDTLDHIKQSEGLRLNAYKDPGSSNGLPITIGYGTTQIDGKPIKLGTTITQAQAERYLREDVERFSAQVAAAVKVSLNDNQFGALVSLAYNIGIGAFRNSTLLRKLNAGDYNSVPEQFRRWVFNDGKRMQGLANRREKEIALWFKPVVKSPESLVQQGESNGVVPTIVFVVLAILGVFLAITLGG